MAAPASPPQKPLEQNFLAKAMIAFLASSKESDDYRPLLLAPIPPEHGVLGRIVARTDMIEAITTHARDILASKSAKEYNIYFFSANERQRNLLASSIAHSMASAPGVTTGPLISSSSGVVLRATTDQTDGEANKVCFQFTSKSAHVRGIAPDVICLEEADLVMNHVAEIADVFPPARSIFVGLVQPQSQFKVFVDALRSSSNVVICE